jgi:hypothetical protein
MTLVTKAWNHFQDKVSVDFVTDPVITDALYGQELCPGRVYEFDKTGLYDSAIESYSVLT